MARAKLQSLGALCMVVIAPVVALPYFQHNEVELGLMTLFFGSVFLSIVPILKYRGEVWLATCAGGLALLGSAVTGVCVLGGLDSYASKWLLIPPIYALASSGVVLGSVWFAIALGAYTGLFIAIQQGVLTPVLVFPRELMPMIGASNFVVFLFASWVLLLAVDASHLWLVKQLRASTQEAEDARDEAQRTGQARARFLANMSHELRTPMNAVIGYTEIVEEELHDMDIHDLDEELGLVLRSSNELISMISDILEVTQVDSSVREVAREELEMLPFLGKITEAGEAMASERNNTFTLRSHEHLDLEHASLEVDAFMLEKLLTSLIENACRFTEHGRVTLAIDPGKAEGALELSVADTGVGIAAKDLGRIWEDFVQVDDSSTRTVGGMGLGLGMVRRYCDLLEIAYAIESEVGVGTTVTLTIPSKWLAGVTAS